MKSIMEEASSITKAIESAWNRAGQPQEFSVKILELPKTTFFGLKTEKSAKIALFFTEVVSKVKEHAPYNKPVARPNVRTPHGTRAPSDEQKSAHPVRRPLASNSRPERQERPERSQESRDTRENNRPMPAANQRPLNASRPVEPRKPYVARQPERTEQAGAYPPRSEGRRPETRTYEQSSGEPRETWSPEMVDAAQEWVKETLVLMGKPEIAVIPTVSHNYLKLSLDNAINNDLRQEETQLKSWGNLAMEAVREKTNKPLRSLRIVLDSKK